MPPTLGSVERMKSTSWFSTSRLKSQRQAPLLAVGQRHGRHLPQLGDVLQRVLVAHRILDEERVERLDRLADAQRVVEVEALVEVDAPVAVGSDALAHVACTPASTAPHDGARVVDAADRHVRRRPCGTRGSPPPSSRWRARARLSVAAGRRAGRRTPPVRVALAVVARRAAEQLVHRQPQRLALDVPQREVERAERVGLLAARRIEPGDVRLLPDRLDPERVLADQRPGALLERVLGAALADAGDADVGLDRAPPCCSG